MVLFVLPAILLVYAYAGWRLTSALGHLTAWPRQRIRWSVQFAAGYLVIYPLLLVLASLLNATALNDALRGGEFWTKLFFIFPFWIGLIIVVEILPFLLALDLSRFLLRPLFKKYQSLWLKSQACITVSLFAILTVYVPVRIRHDTYSIRLTEREAKIPHLTDELEGFRLVQLSDLQADTYTGEQKMLRYIDLANSQKPDLIVFCGDLVTRGTDHIERGAKMMGRLQARLGVYACLGDHDYWANPHAIAQQLKENRVVVIEDSVLTLTASPSKISLTTVTNIYNRRPSAATLDRLRQQRNDTAAVHLLLSHQPSDELIQFAQRHGYHLLLAGHTHGGQIVFKPFGIPLNVSQTETRYYSGFFKLGDLFLSVTNGLGLTFAPFRYQAPAEVTLITLRRA